jgi:hypothetical protein
MNPSPLAIGAAVLLSTLLAPLGHAAVPDSQYWIYDGTSYAQVVWQNGSSTQDPQSYFSLVPPASSLSAVTFADATANSMAAGVAAQSMAVGSRGSHAAQADARANNTLYGFTSGTYLVSFSYELGPQYTGSATASPEIVSVRPSQLAGEVSPSRPAPTVPVR